MTHDEISKVVDAHQALHFRRLEYLVEHGHAVSRTSRIPAGFERWRIHIQPQVTCTFEAFRMLPEAEGMFLERVIVGTRILGVYHHHIAPPHLDALIEPLRDMRLHPGVGAMFEVSNESDRDLTIDIILLGMRTGGEE